MFWPRAGVFLTSEDLLIDFDEAVYDNPDVALAAQELTVQLRDPFSLESLRHSLAAPTFLTDLIIFLPSDTSPVVLDGLRFPRLELFKTNLPHHYLLDFLPGHPSLTDLCLDACGRAADEACPLGHLDLHCITTIECPVGCVHGVAHPGLLRLTAQVQHPVGIESPTMLQSLAAPLTSLFALTLDIFPDNYNILRSVVISVPRVAALKLLEHPRSSHRKPQGRRAWTNVKSWAGQLARLGNLADFALRTSATMSRTLRSEETTFSKWVLRGSSTVPHAHPMLTSLRVWYRCCEADGGVLTYWSRSTGTWANIARVVGPAPDTPF